LICNLNLEGPGCSYVGVGALSENGHFKPNGNVLLRNGYSWSWISYTTGTTSGDDDNITE
ncbi:hypothetical protein MKX01_041274, partial [Papaver californicum]